MFLAPDLNFFFFFNDTATTEIYTLSLHDALPISRDQPERLRDRHVDLAEVVDKLSVLLPDATRSEEHTSELQSPCNLVCRLLLEKKKTGSRRNRRDDAVISEKATLHQL